MPDAQVRRAGFGLVRYVNGEKVASATDDDGAAVAFVPADVFEGPRAGMIFQTGPQGTGYYRDANAAPAARPLASRGAPFSSDGPMSSQVRSSQVKSNEAEPARQRPSERHRARPALSEEEKAERLQRMMADAQSHDAHRSKRTKAEAHLLVDRHGIDEAAAAARAGGVAGAANEDGDVVPDFVNDIAKSTFGEGSVADRINQQSNSRQRGGRAADSFLSRR